MKYEVSLPLGIQLCYFSLFEAQKISMHNLQFQIVTNPLTKVFVATAREALNLLHKRHLLLTVQGGFWNLQPKYPRVDSRVESRLMESLHFLVQCPNLDYPRTRTLSTS